MSECKDHAWHIGLWEALYAGSVVEEPLPLVPLFDRIRESYPIVKDQRAITDMCGIVTELYRRVACDLDIIVAEAEVDMGETNHIVGITAVWEPKTVYVVDFTARQFWPCAPVPLVVRPHLQP